MFSRQILVATMLVAVLVAPVAAVTGTQQAEGYSGTHVAFQTQNDALADYAINDETVFESVKVQSQSQVEGGIGVDAGLSAVTGFAGAGLSLASQSNVRASVTAESGARMTAHDNSRGILVVSSGGSGQYVSANLSGDAEAAQESDQRVVVTQSDGTEGTFLVVGDGEVTVNERNNVTARLGSNGKLVYRAYPDGRSDDDRQQEEMITSGQAAAEVFVLAEEGGDQGESQTYDVVQYSQDTTVQVEEQSRGTLRMTAERSQSQGKVIICTVSEATFGTVEDANVSVDGEAATRVSSYSELRGATQGGDSSAYMVRQRSSAAASGEVLVGVNHFSSREVTVSGSGEGGASGGFGPGFGATAALIAIVALAGALIAGRRQ